MDLLRFCCASLFCCRQPRLPVVPASRLPGAAVVWAAVCGDAATLGGPSAGATLAPHVDAGLVEHPEQTTQVRPAPLRTSSAKLVSFDQHAGGQHCSGQHRARVHRSQEGSVSKRCACSCCCDQFARSRPLAARCGYPLVPRASLTGAHVSTYVDCVSWVRTAGVSPGSPSQQCSLWLVMHAVRLRVYIPNQ